MISGHYPSVIGLEISEKYFTLVQVDQTDQGPLVSRFKRVETPLKTVMNGEIIDSEMLANHLSKVLLEGDFTSTFIVVSFNDTRYVKVVDSMEVDRHSSIGVNLEMHFSNHSLFSQDDFQFGYVINRDGDEDLDSVFSVALAQSRVEAVEELVENAGLSLVGIDIPPVSVLRSMLWPFDGTNGVMMTLYINDTFIDINIVKDHYVLMTQTIRIHADDMMQDSVVSDTVLQRIGQLMGAYSDAYPYLDMPKDCILFSTTDGVNLFLERFMALYPHLECYLYDPVSNIQFDPDLFPEEDASELLVPFVSTVGLGLKFFEKFNTTVTIIKLNRRLSPIVDHREVSFWLAILMSILVLAYGSHRYINYLKETLGDRVQETKQSILALQSGEYLSRQKKLEQLQKQIRGYVYMRQNPFPKSLFIKNIVEELPQDVVFSDVTITKENKVRIVGSAIYQDSIYQFYNRLKASYPDVLISTIDSIQESSNSWVYQFKLGFTWSETP